jgi:hypothetical protein
MLSCKRSEFANHPRILTATGTTTADARKNSTRIAVASYFNASRWRSHSILREQCISKHGSA